MKFPISVGTPEMRLAEALAKELVIECHGDVGFDPGLALPFAISLMAACEEGHDDPDKGVAYLREARRTSDEWWVEHYPDSKFGGTAKKRLREKVIEGG